MRINWLYVLLLLPNLAFTQATTTILQPGPATGTDAWVTSYPGNENSNYGTNQDIAAVSWTASGNSFVSRTYFMFDLTSIPTTASIQSATLDLTFNPNSGHAQGNQGSNACFIRRVTSTWQESTVTWNNQPSFSNVNEVTLLASTSTTQSYPNIDLTVHVQDMVTSPAANFGFVMMLQTEATFRSLVMSSSDHALNANWPKLTVVWTDTSSIDSITCIDYVNDSTSGKDAWVTSYPGNENANFGNSPDIAAVAWTASGQSFISRSYFEYDFSNIPVGTPIISADLSLRANSSSGHAQGHQSQSGSNESVIKTVTSAWSETAVTWNNQPTTTNSNAVTLAQSTSSLQDYNNISITPLVQAAVDAPANNFGFQYSLVTEQQFRSMVFASSDHQNANLRPFLRVCYEEVTGIADIQDQNIKLNVFPNPFQDELSFAISGWPGDHSVDVTILSTLGSVVMEMKEAQVSGNHPITVDGLPNLARGIYFLKVEGEEIGVLEATLIKK